METGLTVGIISLLGTIANALFTRHTAKAIEEQKGKQLLALEGEKGDWQAQLEKQKSEYQREIENLKSSLTDHLDEERARRQYEFEARKRLYHTIEPLFFEFTELCENASYRIRGFYGRECSGELAEWTKTVDLYMIRSSVYVLFAPVAQFLLIRRRMTDIDLRLDPLILRRYMIAKQVYLSFSDDFSVAHHAKLRYEPNSSAWETAREQSPEVHWRQGLPIGLVEAMAGALILKEPGGDRVMSFGEYDKAIMDNQPASPPFAPLKHYAPLAFDMLLKFVPRERPVLWRVFLSQALLYQAFKAAKEAKTTDDTIDIDKARPTVLNQILESATADDQTARDSVESALRDAAAYLGSRSGFVAS